MDIKELTLEKDKYGGAYYNVKLTKNTSECELELECIDDIEAFCCSYRKKLFFMSAVCGKSINEIPYETQWLAIKHKDGEYSIYFSVADKFRTSFYGMDNKICVSAITGDSTLLYNSLYACYKIKGKNLYELLNCAGKSICDKFGTVRRREEKKKPDFMDYFGWCTWDSFYEKITKQDVIDGLKRFSSEGFVPKFIILDDGWQSVNQTSDNRGYWKLFDFKPNEKFNNSLKELVDLAKNDFGVEKFFVWHAIMGYWGGIDTDSPQMKKYLPQLNAAQHPETYKKIDEKLWEFEQYPFGIINPDKSFDFYNDYHSYLKNEGIDGVKVDVQYEVEGHSEAFGGRKILVKKVREGLEASVCYNFDGEIINCMSCSNDIIYNTKNTNMMRSSNDFYPEIPESHLFHIYDNAINSMWMSQFTYCDWDMFQTTHEYGPFHAAARAISGGPVYVSDKVDSHDFNLIRSLVNDEGRLLSPISVAMPTIDCVFDNPIESKKAYKIFNKNKYNGVIGVFAFNNEEQVTQVRSNDIDGFNDGLYATYSNLNKNFLVVNSNQSVNISVKEKEADILTFAKIENGFAVIGTIDKLNCGGSVQKMYVQDDYCWIEVISSGDFVFYSEQNIKSISINAKKCDYEDCENGFYKIKCVENNNLIMVFF